MPAGFNCTRAELSDDIKQLYQTGLFESVNARVLPQKKGKFKVRCKYLCAYHLSRFHPQAACTLRFTRVYVRTALLDTATMPCAAGGV